MKAQQQASKGNPLVVWWRSQPALANLAGGNARAARYAGVSCSLARAAGIHRRCSCTSSSSSSSSSCCWRRREHAGEWPRAWASRPCPWSSPMAPCELFAHNYGVDLLPTGLEKKTETRERRRHQGPVSTPSRRAKPDLRAEGPFPELRPQLVAGTAYARSCTRGARRFEDGGAAAQTGGPSTGQQGRRHGDRARLRSARRSAPTSLKKARGRPGVREQPARTPGGEAGMSSFGNKMWSGAGAVGTSPDALPKTRYQNHRRRPLCPRRN